MAAAGAVPVGVLLLATEKASEGAASPAAAVVGVLGGLSPWVDDLEGVDRYLADDGHEALRAELAEMRARLMADDPSYTVDSENFRTAGDGDSARVTVDVGLTWAVSGEGGALFSSSETFRWTFTTVNESGFGNGWKVAGIDHPDVCEAYVRC